MDTPFSIIKKTLTSYLSGIIIYIFTFSVYEIYNIYFQKLYWHFFILDILVLTINNEIIYYIQC